MNDEIIVLDGGGSNESTSAKVATNSHYDNKPDEHTNDNYKSIAKGHVDIYKFIDDLYNYEGGFEDGTYLTPFPNEKRYNYRGDFSYLVNFFRPIIDSMVVPVFAKPPVRSEAKARGWDAFIENCDVSGSDLDTMMKDDIAKNFRSKSSCIIVVDNVRASDATAVYAQEAVEKREIPYIYTKDHCEVKAFEKDSIGKLISITFCDGEIEIGSKKYESYKTWDSMRCVKWHEQKDNDGKDIKMIDEEIFHNLKIIPVIIVKDSYCKQKQIFPRPKMYGAARINNVIFNKDSEMREFERKCAMAMIANNVDGKSSFGIGNGMILNYPVGANAPQWFSPDFNILGALLDSRNSVRDDLFATVEQLGVTANKVKEASGVSLAYQFSAHNAVLTDTSNICQDAEYKIYDIYCRYLNTPDADYTVEYNKEFLPHDAAKYTALDQFAFDNNAPDIIKGDLWKSFYQLRFPEKSREELDKYIDLIEAELVERATMANNDKPLTPEEQAELDAANQENGEE